MPSDQGAKPAKDSGQKDREPLIERPATPSPVMDVVGNGFELRLTHGAGSITEISTPGAVRSSDAPAPSPAQ